MPRTTLRSSFLVAVAATCLALLLSEGALRLVSWFNPQVRYLANAGVGNLPPVLHTFEEYLTYRAAQLRPHQPWHGFYTNSFGLNDRDFPTQKAADAVRIMGLGDSFLYSLVDYPSNVFNRAGAALEQRCSPHIETLNLGIPGANVWDYKTVYDLTNARLQPDFVVLHLYLGNDGADTFSRNDWLPKARRHSYLWTLIRNLRIAYVSERPVERPITGAARNVRGAAPVPGATPLTDESPTLAQPAFSDSAWQKMMRDELLHFFRPTDGRAIEQSWRRILATITELDTAIRMNHQQLAIVLYPSRLQIEESTFRDTAARFTAERGGGPLPGAFEPELPNQILLDFCRAQHLSCVDLTPAIREAAARGAPLYAPNDTHWNIAGNAAAAEAEAQFLQGILPCSQPMP